MRLLGDVPGGGFSMNRRHASIRVAVDHTERGWIFDRREVQRGLGAVAAVKCDQGGDVEIGEHIAVGDDERGIDARVQRREPDCATRIERLGLDCVDQRRARRTCRRGRPRTNGSGRKPECERDLGDAAASEVADEALDDRHVANRQHRFGDAVGQWSEPGAEAPDEHDRAHQPPEVVVTAAATVVAEGSPTTVVAVDPAGTVPPGTVSPGHSGFAGHGGFADHGGGGAGTVGCAERGQARPPSQVPSASHRRARRRA